MNSTSFCLLNKELGIHTGQIEALQKDISSLNENVKAIKEEMQTVIGMLSEYKGYGKSLVGMAAAVGSILSSIITGLVLQFIHRGS